MLPHLRCKRLAIPARLGPPDNVVDFGPKNKCYSAAFLTRRPCTTGALMGSFVKLLTSVRKANPVRLCFLPAVPRRLGPLWVLFAPSFEVRTKMLVTLFGPIVDLP